MVLVYFRSLCVKYLCGVAAAVDTGCAQNYSIKKLAVGKSSSEQLSKMHLNPNRLLALVRLLQWTYFSLAKFTVRKNRYRMLRTYGKQTTTEKRHRMTEMLIRRCKSRTRRILKPYMMKQKLLTGFRILLTWIVIKICQEN